MGALTPAEYLVVLLGDGRTLPQAARAARLDPRDAFLEASEYGWPDRAKVREAAADIVRRQRDGATPTTQGETRMSHRTPPARRGSRPDLPVEPDVAEVLGRVTPEVGALATSTAARDAAADAQLEQLLAEAAPAPARRDGVDQALIEDTAAILQVLDRVAEPPSDRATLTMPLLRLVDVDGETVIGEAVVDVELDRDGVLRALAAGGEGIVERGLRATVTRRLTPEGAEAIRSLALLLEDGGAA